MTFTTVKSVDVNNPIQPRWEYEVAFSATINDNNGSFQFLIIHFTLSLTL